MPLVNIWPNPPKPAGSPGKWHGINGDRRTNPEAQPAGVEADANECSALDDCACNFHQKSQRASGVNSLNPHAALSSNPSRKSSACETASGKNAAAPSQSSSFPASPSRRQVSPLRNILRSDVAISPCLRPRWIKPDQGESNQIKPLSASAITLDQAGSGSIKPNQTNPRETSIHSRSVAPSSRASHCPPPKPPENRALYCAQRDFPIPHTSYPISSLQRRHSSAPAKRSAKVNIAGWPSAPEARQSSAFCSGAPLGSWLRALPSLLALSPSDFWSCFVGAPAKNCPPFGAETETFPTVFQGACENFHKVACIAFPETSMCPSTRFSRCMQNADSRNLRHIEFL